MSSIPYQFRYVLCCSQEFEDHVPLEEPNNNSEVHHQVGYDCVYGSENEWAGICDGEEDSVAEKGDNAGEVQAHIFMDVECSQHVGPEVVTGNVYMDVEGAGLNVDEGIEAAAMNVDDGADGTEGEERIEDVQVSQQHVFETCYSSIIKLRRSERKSGCTIYTDVMNGNREVMTLSVRVNHKPSLTFADV